MGGPSPESDRTRESSRLRRALRPVLAAIIPPMVAYGIDRLSGPALPRMLLFNSAVIISSWVGGLESGIAATALSTVLVWSLMEPAATSTSRLYVTAGFFLAVGIAISVFHARLRRANRGATEALSQVRRAMSDLSRAQSELERANQQLQRTTRDLNQSKGLLQAVFDHSPNAIVVKDLQGKFLLTNRRFDQVLGLAPGQSRGMTDFDVLDPEDARRHREVDATVVKSNGPVATEDSGEVKGAMRHFLETVFPLRDATGHCFGVCWIGTEITDIKHTEETLAKTAADLKEAQRVAHIGSWRFDLKSEALEWSEELYRIHGMDPSRPPPTYREDLPRMLTAESMAALKAALAKLVNDREPYELELETVHPDGTNHWISTRGEPLHDASGRLVAIRGTSQDITQLKHLQRLKEEWMSLIAHDLRQPIGVIKTSAELLKELHSDQAAPQDASITGRICAAAKGLARMVDDLLDMSRIETHHLSLERAWVDPGALVRQTLASLSYLTTGSPVTVSIGRELSQVYVDLVRFEQILGNLISNAAKYGEKKAEIAVQAAQRGSEVEISVSNRGAGIPPEDVPRLFSRFGRSTSARGVAGLGLGLYIAKGLVEAHGGRMWVDSVPGHTTTFHFTLPSRATSKEAA
jgi:PAS domain S-box-containing protein